MRVLLITNYKKGTGGISGQVELLYNNILKENIGTAIFNTKGNFLYRITCPLRLLRIASSYNVFHIHCCSNIGFYPAIVGITVGKITHKRIVLTYHGGDAESFFAKHKRLVRHFLLRTDTNIVLSGFLGTVFERYGIPHQVLPNILDFNKDHFRIREVLKPNFISIRTLSPLYNIECILKAFKIVKSKLSYATLTIVGSGPSMVLLQQFVIDENISDVEFTGRVANTEIYKYLDKCDIMLSSPRIDNMPVSLLEAFNAGVLVISSNVGGVPYMINDGENGLLFESSNHIELAEKMLDSVMNTERSKQMILSAKDSLKLYTWSYIRKKLLKIYGY